MPRRPAAIRALALAASALTGACASTGGVPRPFPIPQSRQPQAPASAGRSAAVDGEEAVGNAAPVDDYALVGTALALRGVPYRNGGDGPDGFDCSGFTRYVYAQHGVALPREVRDQFQQGKSVDAADLAAGDLLFFTTVAPGPTHVGISIGGDQFVHAPSSTGVVRVEHLRARYWSTRYLGARRVT